MIAKIIGILISIVFGIAGLQLITSKIGSINTDGYSSDTVGLINVLPIVYVAVIIVGIFGTLFGRTAIYNHIKRWNDLGNRMKAAYAAKFGGENKGFNEEVDYRIKIMKSLGHGYTKEMAEDWLKRMCKFVEIPYIVPEEEHISEEEKTREFGDD